MIKPLTVFEYLTTGVVEADETAEFAVARTPAFETNYAAFGKNWPYGGTERRYRNAQL